MAADGAHERVFLAVGEHHHVGSRRAGRRRPWDCLLAVLALVGLSIACSEDSADPPPPPNLAPAGVRILDANGSGIANPVFQMGHPVKVELAVSSATTLSDVAAHLYIIDRQQFDNAPDTAQQYLIGAVSIDWVAAGLWTYVVEVLVPYTDEDFDLEGKPVYRGNALIPQRSYYVFAQLDPADLVAEADEEDNRPALANFPTETVVVTLSDEKKATPNVYLEDVVLDVDLRMLDLDFLFPEPESEPSSSFCGELPPEPDPASPFDDLVENLGNTHLGLTAVVNATGAYFVNGIPAPIPRVDVEAKLRWDARGQTWEIPVQVWDSEAGAYRESFSVLDVAPGVPQSVQVDFRLDVDLDPASAAKIDALRDHLFQAGAVCLDPMPGSVCPNIPVFSCISQSLLGRRSLEECATLIDAACIWSCFEREFGTGFVQVDLTAWDGVGPGASQLPDFQPPGFDFSSFSTLPSIRLTPPSVQEILVDSCPGCATTGSRSFEGGFAKAFAPKGAENLAAARVDMRAVGSLNSEGAGAHADASAGVTLFGKDLEVLGLLADGLATPSDLSRTHFEIELRSDLALTSDQILFARNLRPCDNGVTVQADLEWEVLSKLAEKACVTKCGSNQTCVNDCRNAVKSFTRSKEVSKTFVIVVVPVTARFSAAAAVGFSTGVALPACEDTSGAVFQAYAGPYLDIDSSVSAGVGIAGFSAGAKAEATLVADTFYTRAQVLDLRFEDPYIRGVLGEDIVNTLTGPNGAGYLYLEYPCGIKWCGWRPCLKRCQKREELFSFETFEKTDVLFCDSQNVSVDLGL